MEAEGTGTGAQKWRTIVLVTTLEQRKDNATQVLHIDGRHGDITLREPNRVGAILLLAGREIGDEVLVVKGQSHRSEDGEILFLGIVFDFSLPCHGDR